MIKLNFREWQIPSADQSINDFEIVREILLSTWLSTYSEIIPPEELKSYLKNTCNDEKLEELLKNKFTKGIIAEANGKPAGWMRTNIDPVKNKFYINQLYVLNEYQGKGIGKKLLNIAEEEASRNKFKKICLAVMSENLPAFKWYKSQGFIFEKEIPFKMISSNVNHLLGWKEIHN